MKKQNRMKIMGKENTYLYSLCIVMACMIINMIIWKPYYHVNDDYIIRDILSGRYSGVADAHIYNVIYLFAWILMKLYAMFSTVDIWGGYLWLMMYVCMFLIITRVLRKSGYNVIVLLFTAIFLNIGLLYGMNFFTFTTTGAVCAATGLFLWSTDENKFSWRGYFIPLLLMLASFCTRKDTFFMVLPFYVLACIHEIVSSPKRKTVLEKLKAKLLSPQPEAKPIRIKKFYECPWNIGDVFAYPLISNLAKENGLHGKFIIFQVAAKRKMKKNVDEYPVVRCWIAEELTFTRRIR